MEQKLPSDVAVIANRISVRLIVLGSWLVAGCHGSGPPPAPQPATSSTPADAPAPAGRGTDSAVRDPAIGPPLTVVDAETAPRTNADLLRNPDFHQAIDDVRRLRLISYFQEVRRGLLRVEAGSQFETGTSVQYNFTRLHSAYSKSIDYYGEAIIEIWQRGRKIGESTRDGLLLGPEYSTPRN
jgi:hypothetical protein